MSKIIGYERVIGLTGSNNLIVTQRLAHEFFRLAANSQTAAQNAIVDFQTTYKNERLIIQALVYDYYENNSEIDKIKQFIQALPDFLRELIYIQSTECSYPISSVRLGRLSIAQRPDIGFRSPQIIMGDPLLDAFSTLQLVP